MAIEGLSGNAPKRDENSIILDKLVIADHEALDPVFEKAIEAGIEDALARLKARFENAQNPLDNLEYHNTFHTEDVMRRTRLILRAITKNDERLIRLGEFIAANHDTVQNYDVVEENGKKMRKRRIEKNEQESAEQALTYLDTIDGQILTPKERDIVEKAILATIPGFVVNKEERYATVVQPNLNEQSDILVRAVALADLGTAGMDGSEFFVLEGAANFREDGLDIAEALQNPATITEEKKQAYIQRMLMWSDFQPGFARGREKLLMKELTGLPDESQRAVAALFDKFYESIQGSQAKADMRRAKIESGDWTFEDLAHDFGYKF
ncbi:hypothetical protein EXS57_00145 [Candidatus Kaiserbacteria bacterium]|nr:hypothetical protein [Candidatus Kaiserbacteria bacterium]